MVYPPKIWERADSARLRVGREGKSLGRAASFRCGCFLEFALEVDDGVKNAAFRTNGCGYMVASADVLSETVAGQLLSDLHGLSDVSLLTSIEAEIGVLSPARRQCAEVCIEALHAAFQDHRARQIEEFRGEKALICTCFGVTEEAVDDYIRKNGAKTVDDVTAACRAGGGCGSCRMLIQEMLDGNAAYDISTV